MSAKLAEAEASLSAHVKRCYQCSGPDDGCEEGQRLEDAVFAIHKVSEVGQLRQQLAKVTQERDDARRSERQHWTDFERKALECESLRRQLAPPKPFFADWNNPVFDGHCALKTVTPLADLNTENAGE